MIMNLENVVMALLSSFIRELEEGKDYLEANLKTAKEITNLFKDSKSIADLNHNVINSAMNIMALTDNEDKVQDECEIIINSVRSFTGHAKENTMIEVLKEVAHQRLQNNNPNLTI